jgi:hypothetical protein
MKIKSIKEIVNGDSDKELVHIIGEVVTKKEKNLGIGKKNVTKRLCFLVKSGNYCIRAELKETNVKDYKYLAKLIKIDKQIYLEGMVMRGMNCTTYTLDVFNASSNIMLKKLEHEDKTLEIGFLMELFSGNEKKAVDIVNTYNELDVNFKYNGSIAVFSAIFPLVCPIVNFLFGRSCFQPPG